ncbi:MAG: flagellin, partial [Dethiobacteria bacterium]
SLDIGDMRASKLGVGISGAQFEVTVTGIDGQDALDIGAEQTEKFTARQLSKSVTIGSTDYNYGLFNEDGDVIAISEDGTSYRILDAAVSESTLNENTNLNDAIDFADPVISGSVTAVAGTDGGSGYTVDLTATATVSEDVQLDVGEYTVVDDTHDDIDSGFGLVDAEGNVVAVSDDGATWTDINTGDTVLTLSTQLAADNEINVVEKGIDVSTAEAADTAITTIQSALDTVSSERSKLGALQNRLDHTIANLSVAAENLSAAESRIRDVDMASEMMEFTKNQILSQAGTAMLAQANLKPQTILQLLA